MVSAYESSTARAYLFESNVDYFVYNGDIILIDRTSRSYVTWNCCKDFSPSLLKESEGMEVSNR